MKITICLFIAVVTLGSCSSVDQNLLYSFAKKGYTRPLQADSVYRFRNEPFMSHNRIGLTDAEPLENPYPTLWYQMDFKSKLNMDELRGAHVRITSLSKRRLKFELLSPEGQLIQSRKRRITHYRDFVQTKSRISFRNKYIVINGIVASAMAMSLTQEGNLLVAEESGGMVFLIVMPFGGTSFTDTYEYRPYIEQ